MKTGIIFQILIKYPVLFNRVNFSYLVPIYVYL